MLRSKLGAQFTPVRRQCKMTSYKEPSFQQRRADAAEAKGKALNRLRSRPPLDESLLAERQAKSLKREASKAHKMTKKKATERAAAQQEAAEV